jgi:hypothetical protein
VTTSRAELVSLLRGYFSCPVLAALADSGLTKRMRSGTFTPDDLSAANRSALLAVLTYLRALGLVEPTFEGAYRLTQQANTFSTDPGRFTYCGRTVTTSPTLPVCSRRMATEPRSNGWRTSAVQGSYMPGNTSPWR